MIEIAAVRLLQLVSPSLPTGAFSYSQGIEWAVEQGWIDDGASLEVWLGDIMTSSLTHVDIPLLNSMYQGCLANDLGTLMSLCDTLLACRDSYEMKQEEINRGRAMATLLQGLGLLSDPSWKEVICKSQLAGFALAAARWQIPLLQAGLGYLWSWLENQVLTGIKIIPLGQTEGQQLLIRLGEMISPALARGLIVPLNEIGASSPALALASSLHESQYTRIYRS